MSLFENTIEPVIAAINNIVWGPPMLMLLAGTGLFLMLGLQLMPLRKLGYGFKQLFTQHKNPDQQGEISAFNALMTALAATIGTGNIAGVATAIFMGGPGAMFWMWCIAMVGMATKFSEALLAVHFRENDSKGHYIGGPMYYIKNGLHKRWHFLAYAFAGFGLIAGFGIGNGVQAHSVADALQQSVGLDKKITAALMCILVFLCLIGGIKRISSVAGKLVPFMALAYVLACLIIIFTHISQLPGIFQMIIHDAFSGSAATGGFAGATVWAAIRFGVARGVFSNEAGLGSAPIAHASAKTDNPVRQGTIAMLGTFIDTIIICSMTGFVILLSGQWTSGVNGAGLSTLAFEHGLPFGGAYIVSLSLAIFAFTTIIGWSVYGERCAQFLFGEKAILPFRILWSVMVPVGAMMNLEFIWLLADTLNALMALPNLIALLLLSPVVFKLSKNYFAKK
jgi:alanine or glycine:cation symporter, AGCS family